MSHASVQGHTDFRRLWTGLAISQLGSTVGMVALPIVAIVVVRATTFQVSLLAALAAATIALTAFPVGTFVEYHLKRPITIGSDIARFVSIGSVPVAGLFGSITLFQLCVVAIVNAVSQVAFYSASQAHLKSLVSRDRLVDANARLESTTWLSLSVGPSSAGALVALLTAPFTLAIDAVSFIVNALVIRSIRTAEPVPSARDRTVSRRRELTGGLRFVWAHRTLRPMLISWITFAGANMMAYPLSTVLYLRDLGFTPWQYGLLMGIPSLGGFLGARLTRRFVSKFGAVRWIWWASMLRGPWFFVAPLAVPGYTGLTMCGVAFFTILVFSATANSAMSSYRQLQTPDQLMARVASLWQFSTVVTQPLFVIAGGALAVVLTTRQALLVAAALLCLAALLLPRRERHPSQLALSVE